MHPEYIFSDTILLMAAVQGWPNPHKKLFFEVSLKISRQIQ